MEMNKDLHTPMAIKRGRSMMSFATAAVSVGDKYRITKYETASLNEGYIFGRDNTFFSMAGQTIGTGVGDRHYVSDHKCSSNDDELSKTMVRF